MSAKTRGSGDTKSVGRAVLAVPATVLVAVLVVVGVGTASPAAGAAAGRPVVVDPALAARVAAGPVPALLWWDENVAGRSEIAAYLSANEIDAHVFERLPGALACSATAEAVGAMAAAPGAVSVWGDHGLTPALDESVPTAFNGDPKRVWQDLGITGKGVGVAVLDTGVDATHTDLEYGTRTKLNIRVLLSHEDLLGPGGDPCITNQYTGQLEDSELTSGHGTHMASVAAGDGTASDGRYTGMAPEADLVGVGVSDTVTPRVVLDEDAESEISLLGAIAGINYVLLNGLEGAVRVKVILAGWTQDRLYDPWHPMARAIEGASEFGITVVFPVGNDGPEQSDCSTEESCHFNPWAADPHAVGVAATPKRSRSALEPYSSRGDPQPRQVRNHEVHYEPTLAAPGTGVVAARRLGLSPYLPPSGPGFRTGLQQPAGLQQSVELDPRYVGLTGTSVAAAHVAGAVALMQQAAVGAKGCYLTPAQVKDVLAGTATAMNGYQTWEVGAGALDATAAVLGAVEAPLIPSRAPWMCPDGGS